MSFFDIFKKKPHHEKIYPFAEEDRELSLRLRRANAELKELQIKKEIELQKLEFETEKLRLQQEIEDLKGDDDGFNAEGMLMQLITPIFNKPLQQPNPPGQQVSPVAPVLHLEDNQIEDILRNVDKKYIKVAQNMPEEQLKVFIKGQIPNIDDDSIKRSILIIKDR